LQHPWSDQPDEAMFQIVAQAMELLFKATRDEVVQARSAIGADDFYLAGVLLERVKRLLAMLASGWDVYATVTPAGYLGFRDVLKEGSGFQSPSYRRLEFVLGNKQPDMALVHNATWAQQDVQADLHAPSLWDEVMYLLVRRGFLDSNASVLQRDLSQPYELNDDVEQCWLGLYRTGAERDLLLLADQLVEVGTAFHDFRQRHLTTVERLMGHRPGTGGTSGVAWLRRITDHRFFPELWTVRTLM
jgi:tryptophan 2,3-dioxygenase